LLLLVSVTTNNNTFTVPDYKMNDKPT